MKGKSLILLILSLLLVLGLGGGIGGLWAKGPEAPGQGRLLNGPPPVGTAFTYQGRLTDASGPVNGTCEFQFSLWDSLSGTDPAGQVGSTQTVSSVMVDNGLFTVQLNGEGEFGPDAFTGEARWLKIEVQCSGDLAFVPLDPRQELTATPYALSLRPGAVVSASTTDVTEAILRVENAGMGVGLKVDGGSYGIRSSGYFGVHGSGTVGVEGIGSYGVYGYGSSPTGTGVYGTAPMTGTAGIATADTGTTYGVYGQSDSSNGEGVYGYATHGSGYTYGVVGKADSTNGTGVLGYATTSTGITYGAVGKADSVAGRGVYGRAAASTGTTYGVYGQSDSDSGRGVYGYASATDGYTRGVYGVANSPNGDGVYGYAPATGVYGQGTADSGHGVFGEAPKYGVYGYATATSGTTYGVYGESRSADGYGVYGTAPVTGTAGIASYYGVYGEADDVSGRGVFGWASDTTGAANPIGVWGQADATSGTGVFGWATATSGTTYGVYGRTDSSSGYGVFSAGDYGGTGAKYAVVQTKDYGWRHLSVTESPEVWFEDFGQAQLVNGQAVVAIEPIFAQTVNLSETYHVFFTPLGDCGLYVAEKTPASFTVQALGGQTCNIAFDYRIIAKRLGYEKNRLEPAADPNQLTQEMGQMETQQEGP